MSDTVLGLYAHGDADWATAECSIKNFVLVERQDSPEFDKTDCLLIDLRSQASSVLQAVAQWQCLKPIIALVDVEQYFPEDYPFGCALQDHTTSAELGSSLFWYKVASAIKAYTTPLRVGDINPPTYALLQEIVDHSSDWIIVKDLDHRFVLASDNLASMAGIEMQDLIGKNDLEIGSTTEHVLGDAEKNWPGFWPQDDAVIQTGLMSIEENPNWELFSNVERYRRTIRAPLKNHKGETYALLVCSQDITDQRKNEALLDERTVMLAQVTGEKQIAENNRRIAEEAVAAKTKFLAAASHDLRQPLHAMGLFLDILYKRTKGRPEQGLVKQVQQSCTTLNNLFNGCLDISRLDAGVVERSDEDFRISTFLDSINRELTQQAHEKGLRYSYAIDDSVVKTDLMLLGRIFRNLVNNAIQNTESGGITVQCKTTGVAVVLSVSDTGVGIAEEEKLRIFSEFHQVDSRNAQQGLGLGLGLSIVKRLCELLGIELTLESTLGKGSTFSLAIPPGVASNIRDDEEVEQSLNLEGARVLIIDDDKYIRQGMETLLQSIGCETVSAADASLAMNTSHDTQLPPNIIVADYHLSNGKTGTTAIEQIRQTFGSDIPAVLVTGDTTAESEREAAKHALCILYKPVSSDLLLSTISQELQQGRLSN